MEFSSENEIVHSSKDYHSFKLVNKCDLDNTKFQQCPQCGPTHWNCINSEEETFSDPVHHRDDRYIGTHFPDSISVLTIYQEELMTKNILYQFGILYSSFIDEEESLELLKIDMKKDKLLENLWSVCENQIKSKSDFGIYTNSMITEMKIALRVYTMDSNLFKEFNFKTRHIYGQVDFELKFPYRGLFLLLYKAVTDYSPNHKTLLYRGMTLDIDNKEGEIILFRQFISASAQCDIALKRFSGENGTLLIFSENTLALPMEAFSILPEEKVFLILPSTAFKITRIEIIDNVKHIHCEYLEGFLKIRGPASHGCIMDFLWEDECNCYRFNNIKDLSDSEELTWMRFGILKKALELKKMNSFFESVNTSKGVICIKFKNHYHYIRNMSDFNNFKSNNL